MITIDIDDYEYCQSHWIKFTPICAQAIKDHIEEQKQKLISLKKEIPANVDKGLFP